MGKNALGANKSESTKRQSGIASIKVVGDKVRVTFDDDSKEFDTGKNSKTFKLEDMPSKPKLGEGTKNYFVLLNSEADEVESLGPVEGVYTAIFRDFNRQDDESDPAPFDKEPANDKWKPYQAFLAFFEIVSGPYKGITIPYFMHYKFDESKTNPGETAWKGDPDNRKATRLHQVIEFCTKLDLVSEPIEWPEDGNILPVLYDRATENPKKVKLVIKDGYIDSLLSLDEEESSDEDEDEAPVKKSSAKKSPAKKKAPSRKGDEDEDEDF